MKTTKSNCASKSPHSISTRLGFKMFTDELLRDLYVWTVEVGTVYVKHWDNVKLGWFTWDIIAIDTIMGWRQEES